MALGGVIVLPPRAFSDFASSTNFILERGVIDAGGSQGTSSNFGLRSSIAQPATGISTSTNFIIRGGFLYFPSQPTPTSATSTPPVGGGGSGSGGSGGGTGFGGIVTGKPIVTPEIVSRCDFNNDKKCNMIDLSILLYYYEEEGSTVSRYDLNNSRKVDFPDISILLYYWTD